MLPASMKSKAVNDIIMEALKDPICRVELAKAMIAPIQRKMFGWWVRPPGCENARILSYPDDVVMVYDEENE